MTAIILFGNCVNLVYAVVCAVIFMASKYRLNVDMYKYSAASKARTLS